MPNFLAILIGVVLVNHLLLVRLPAFDGGRDDAGGIRLPATAAFVTAVALTLAVAVTGLIDAVLLRPLDLRELRFPALVLGIVGAVPLTALTVGFMSPARGAALRPCRALIVINCVMLGAALLIACEPAPLRTAIAWALATGLAFPFLLALFAELHARLEAADVPPPFAGAAIALVTAGLMSLAFTGVTGMARG